MDCLACGQRVDYRRPIVYMDYDRGVHVDEWVEFVEGAGQAEFARLRKRFCQHQWQLILLGHGRECVFCGKKEYHHAVQKT